MCGMSFIGGSSSNCIALGYQFYVVQSGITTIPWALSWHILFNTNNEITLNGV